MTIRPATLNDIPAIVALGERMHAESPRFSKLQYAPDKVEATFTAAVADCRYFTLLKEEEDGEIIGGFAGFIMPHWCSYDEVAQDLAVFVRPDRRGGMIAARMVKSFVYWAEDRGAKLIALGISTGVMVDETARLYKSLGLKQFGYIFEV